MLTIRLDQQSSPRRSGEPENSIEDVPDDLTSVLYEISACLAAAGVTLEVGGFGERRWPVDVETDLLTLLEQWPDVMNAVTAPTDFSIDFYEQGIQRRIDFHHTGDHFVARCTSSTSWVPNPREETIQAEDLRAMLTAFTQDVVAKTRTHCPAHAASPCFQEWARSFPQDHRR